MKSSINSSKTKVNDDLSVDEKEELAFTKMILGVDRTKKVNRKTIFKLFKEVSKK